VGIEALCAALEDSARERAQKQLNEAHFEAARLRHSAKQAAARRLARAVRRQEAELRRATRNEIAAAGAAARERVLRARDDLIARVFTKARELLPEMAASRSYRSSLTDQLQRALAYVPGPARVQCAPPLARDLEAALAERTEVELEVDPELPPGFRVCSADGRRLVDATLSTRLAVEGPRLAAELVARLGAGS
jgi:vacuolar-type H+-ATPase subunit E/Vma4